MKNLIFLISLLLIACNAGQESTDELAQEQSELADPTQEELKEMELFYNEWHVAIYKDDAWWHIKGCPDYKVYIEDVGRDGEFGRITMTDRLGLSVWMKAAIKQIDIEEKGRFRFKCVDEYNADREFVLSGKMTRFHKIWEAKIIQLDQGYLFEQLIEEIDLNSKVDSINLFVPENVVKFPIKADDIEGCP